MRNSVTLIVMAMLLMALTAHISHAQKQRDRVIKRFPVERNEPLEIVDIKVNGEAVALNKNFPADDDWLKALTVEVRNKSAKSILYASIYLKFPALGEVPENMSIHSLEWGDSSLPTDLPKPGEKTRPLRPGEAVRLAFSAEEFAHFKMWLSGMNYGDSIRQITVSLGQIIFEDDTMWFRGEKLLRKKGTPNLWQYSRYPDAKP